MGEKTGIACTHHTFNPWSGCAKVRAGCANCYAGNLPPRMRRGAQWGEVWQGGTRVVASEDYWKEPFKWARLAAKAGERRRVFCASTADVLEVPQAPREWPRGWGRSEIDAAYDRLYVAGAALDHARERLWPIIEDTAYMCGGCGRPCAHSSDTPHRQARLLDLASVGAACEGRDARCLTTPMGGLDWRLLTKRPENWQLVPGDVRPLVWLGTSVSDQKTADEWVPRLLEADGVRVRFLSVEPLVEPVDLRRCFSQGGDVWPAHLDWVIVGGESGRKARPCHVEWVRFIVRQCREAGVPCFVKQLGYRASDPENGLAGAGLNVPDEALPLVARRLKDGHGGDMAEWPEDLRVQQFPEVSP